MIIPLGFHRGEKGRAVAGGRYSEGSSAEKMKTEDVLYGKRRRI